MFEKGQLIHKNTTVDYFWGNFRKKIGYFLFYHLVTLDSKDSKSFLQRTQKHLSAYEEFKYLPKLIIF